METDEFEVAWSPAIETAQAKAQQRVPETYERKARSFAAQVVAYLEGHPDATMRGIHVNTGIPMQDVNAALYSLLKQGRVERSHRQEDDRTHPVQWRLTT